MSKQVQTGEQGSKSHIKKGMVINRRNNRTIHQGKSNHDPRWDHLGNGILRLKGQESQTAYVAFQNKRVLRSLKKAEILLSKDDL